MLSCRREKGKATIPALTIRLSAFIEPLVTRGHFTRFAGYFVSSHTYVNRDHHDRAREEAHRRRVHPGPARLGEVYVGGRQGPNKIGVKLSLKPNKL